jgi:chromosome segregation ATPase
MPEDNKKPEEGKKAGEATPKSFLDKVTGILKNPDTKKSLTDLAEITGGAGLSQAEKEKMVQEFNENDKKRLAAEKALLDKVKANEAKIQNNEGLLAASREVVQKLELRIAEIDKKIKKLDDEFGELQNEGADLDAEAAELKKKLGI